MNKLVIAFFCMLAIAVPVFANPPTRVIFVNGPTVTRTTEIFQAPVGYATLPAPACGATLPANVFYGTSGYGLGGVYGGFGVGVGFGRGGFGRAGFLGGRGAFVGGVRVRR
jgi:hypothetical protein